MSAGSERPALPGCGSLSMEVRHPAQLRGVTLIECLVYISVLFVILAVAGVVYAQVLDHTRQLRRVSGDITRALDAGERWRADVRTATAAPRLVQEGVLEALHLPQRDAEVVYLFDGSNVVRRVGDDGVWQPFLPRVKAARFVADPRQHVTAWRWEVELLPGPRPARMPPLFSFTAALRPAAP
jgi:hypothetical protein